MTEAMSSAWELISGRQNFTPRRLVEPGPSANQLELLVRSAASAPDHGELLPWRFVHILQDGRTALGEAFRLALLERDAAATTDQQIQAAEKAVRAPCLLLAVLDLGPREKDVPPVEKSVSLGCAIQNMLLMARALGYGSGLSSGRAMDSIALRNLFGLNEHEHAVCFVSFGTVAKARPMRERPAPSRMLSLFPSQALPLHSSAA
jgi:nitroreductase